MKIYNPSFSDIPELRKLWKEAFGDTDDFLDKFFSVGFSTERSMCISEDNKVVSALYWFNCFKNGEKFAYIYAVATAKSHRCQGLCQKLMRITHEKLKDAGYTGAILVPGSKSLFDFYERLGYKICSYVDEFKIKASTSHIIISQINAEEFSELRKCYLPEGALVQEGENLSFLSSFAKFYRGEDFLLAAYKNEDTLTGTEILGSTQNLGAVVNSLNCTDGFFRTPGNSKPFSMYYPFTNADPPSYFGLAFD